MKIRYLDMVGDPVEVDWEQFRTDYKEGKVNPNQNVTFNGTPVSVARLLEIIEEADDHAYVKSATKMKLEDEQFQKTAPWWLKPIIRGIIQWAFLLGGIVATMIKGFAAGVVVLILWTVYQYVSGNKRYNPWFDILFVREYNDIIAEHQRKDKKKKP